MYLALLGGERTPGQRCVRCVDCVTCRCPEADRNTEILNQLLARKAGDRRADSDCSLHPLPASGTDPAAPTSLMEALESRGQFTEQMDEWSQRTGRAQQREQAKHQMRCVPCCTPSSEDGFGCSLVGHAHCALSLFLAHRLRKTDWGLGTASPQQTRAATLGGP